MESASRGGRRGWGLRYLRERGGEEDCIPLKTNANFAVVRKRRRIYII